MKIQISNHKPAILYDKPFEVLPVIDPALPTDDFTALRDQSLRTLFVDPMYVPINTAHPARITDISDANNPVDITPDTLENAIRSVWTSPHLDVNLENQLGEIYRQGARFHTPNDWFFEDQVGVEAMSRSKLPLPSTGKRIVKYTANVDLIPAAKGFLGSLNDYDATLWFANVVGFTRSYALANTLIVTVQDATVWNDFKARLNQTHQNYLANATNMTPATTAALQAFQKIDMSKDLSSGLFLPERGLSGTTQLDPLSFSRLLVHELAQAERQMTPGLVTVQPVNMRQLFLTENIIVLNLENYAHATAKQVNDDWDALTKALNHQKMMSFISNKNLLTAAVVNRNLQKSSAYASASPAMKQQIARARARAFSGTPITSKVMLKRMAAIAQKQITTHVTQNTFKTVKRTFMRANRRQPNNPNLPGKMSTTMYRPDLHVYIDTSGSISEMHYRDAVMNLIALARKLDCNLYVTSWSHVISQTALLQTKGKSKTDIYRQFLAVPKVTGGTELENVWLKIDRLDELNRKRNKSHQINFVITDFEYYLDRDRRFAATDASVKNTYYVPISTEASSWSTLVRYATDFRNQMEKAGDRGIHNRLLM